MEKKEAREKRHVRIRKKISGTGECPRLSVFRSLKHIYGQLIDDVEEKTLLTVSTRSPEIKPEVKKTGDMNAAGVVGKILAKKALEKNITKVVFDRSGYKYHGRIKKLAEAAREAGLKF